MFERILIATDGSNPARRAVTVASDLCAHTNAELIILHVLMHGKVPEGFSRMAKVEHLDVAGETQRAQLYNIPANMAATLSQMDKSLDETRYFDLLADKIIDDCRQLAKSKGAENVQSEVVSGDIAEKILQTAEEKNVDLIMMGARGLSDIKRLLLGSVTAKVMQLGDSPCLIVK